MWQVLLAGMLWANGVSAQEQTAGDSVLEKFVASAGAKGASLEGFELVGKRVLETPQGQLAADVHVYFVGPDRFREEATLPFGTVTSVLDGSAGWAQTPRGVTELTEDQKRRARDSLFRSYLGLLWAVSRGEVESAGALLRVEETEMRARFDESTGRLLEIALPGANLQGAPVEERRVFSGFADLDGLTLPTKVEIFHDDVLAAEVAIESVVVNPSLSPEIFQRPKEEE